MPFSFGLATTIRVGHLVGQQNNKELKTAISTALCMAIFMSFFIACFTFFMRSYVASLYSTDPAVIALASSLLILACFYQLSDAIQVVSACALRGMKITKPVFYITLFAYWPIGFGLGAVLGLTDWLVTPMGAHGFWIGIIIGLSTAAIMLAFILKKHMKRIDNEIQHAHSSERHADASGT